MPDIVYDQYYPGGCFKQLSDAAGGSGITYLQYASGGPANQLRTHIDPGLMLDQHHPGGVWGQAEVAVEGGSGGSSAPEWVPTDAKIYIDFLNDRAWVDGTDEVAVDTLLGSDPNLDGAWGTDGAYSPEDLTADGYVPTTPTTVAFIGSALLALLAGSTFVVRFKQFTTSGSTKRPAVALVSADGSFAIEIDLNTYDLTGHALTVRGQSWAWDHFLYTDTVLNLTVGAVNILAATITSARLEFAANGSDVVSGSLTEEDYPSDTIVAAFLDVGNDYTAIQSITIYDLLPNTTGLSELSEVT